MYPYFIKLLYFRNQKIEDICFDNSCGIKRVFQISVSVTDPVSCNLWFITPYSHKP